MTDLIAAPGADSASTAANTQTIPPNADERAVQWAPHEPAPKKQRTGLWIGVAVGALALAAGAASTVLIAPGTTIAGIPVGGLTPGAAADVVNSRLADVEVTLTDVEGEPTVTGAELGASVDARALAEQAFSEHPMWNLGAWMPEPIAAEITLDPEVAHDALRGIDAASYKDAVDASVSFDAATASYVTTPAVSGTGINLDDLTGAIAAAIADGESALSYSGAPSEAPASVSDADAARTAEQLNGILGTIGFYVGEERTVPIDPAVAATWLDIVDDNGELRISVDEAAIQKVVDTLPGLVNREAVQAEAITNVSGDVLREVTAGVTGRALGDTSTVASDFAEKLAAGEGVQPIEVTETPFTTTTLARAIDVNLSTQTISVIENGTVIDSWPVSTGAAEFPTGTGSFQIGWKTTSQNMGNSDLTKPPYYFQPNVKWVMYYNGDEALHGVYWHENFGTPVSHGCTGMPEWRAQWLYEWAPEGVGVNVYY